MRTGMKTCVSILAGALLLLAALTGCATSYDTYTKMTKAPGAGSFAYEGNVTRWRCKEAMVEASYLSPAGADLYFSLLRGGIYRNPFPPGTCIVFSLLVENRGKSTLTFDPRMTRLYSKGDEPATVKDFSSLYVDLDMAGADRLDDRMKVFRETSFDAAVTLAPGEKVQRLLVYPRGKGHGGKAALVVEGLYVDHAPRTVPLLFTGVD
jgi:hypothetical protein